MLVRLELGCIGLRGLLERLFPFRVATCVVLLPSFVPKRMARKFECMFISTEDRQKPNIHI